MNENYLYEGLEASLYDALDELSDFEDLHFYKWFVDANGGETLDLGCGTGRILLPLAAAGVRVSGLECSKEMVKLCCDRLDEAGLDAPVIRGDMRRFDLGRGRFGAILIPGYSIQMLLTDEDLLDCLRCCREHLAERGQLIFPVYMPWEMIWEESDAMPMSERRTVDDRESGETQKAFQGWEIDRRGQRLKLLNRYQKIAGDGSILSSEDKQMTIRWDMPHEMLRLLEKAGFRDVSMYGDYGFEPAEQESESILYVAQG